MHIAWQVPVQLPQPQTEEATSPSVAGTSAAETSPVAGTSAAETPPVAITSPIAGTSSADPKRVHELEEEDARKKGGKKDSRKKLRRSGEDEGEGGLDRGARVSTISQLLNYIT